MGAYTSMLYDCNFCYILQFLKLFMIIFLSWLCSAHDKIMVLIVDITLWDLWKRSLTISKPKFLKMYDLFFVLNLIVIHLMLIMLIKILILFILFCPVLFYILQYFHDCNVSRYDQDQIDEIRTQWARHVRSSHVNMWLIHHVF